MEQDSLINCPSLKRWRIITLFFLLLYARLMLASHHVNMPLFWLFWVSLLIYYFPAEGGITIYEHGIHVKYLWFTQVILWKDITSVRSFFYDTVIYTKGIRRYFLIPTLHIRSGRPNKKIATAIIKEKINDNENNND